MGPSALDQTASEQLSGPRHARSWGSTWRSHALFAIITVGIGAFTDNFLYGLVVPLLPFMLSDNVGIPPRDHQFYVSQLLSTYAVSSVVCSPFAGFVTDRFNSRRVPFLAGLVALILATILMFTAKTIALLTLARALQGASTALVFTSGLALCRDVVGVKNLGKTIGTIFAFVSVGVVFSPPAGGILYHRSGTRAVAGLALGLLGVAFVMRLLIIEKSATGHDDSDDEDSSEAESSGDEATGPGEANEDSPLLSNGRNVSLNDEYLVSDNLPFILREIPLLYCFKSPSLVIAFYAMFFQGTLFGAFDSTVPLYARELFDFNSMQSGLLFGSLGICDLLLGPLAGWAVDRYGPRIVAVSGYLWLVPALTLLRLPTPEPAGQQIALYAVILGIAGAGLGIINSPPLVQAEIIVGKYHKRNPKVFGPNGPYAQLYGLYNMFFCMGLTIGPILAGSLRSSIGYGNMNAVLAALSGVTAIVCSILLSGGPAE